jgi:hypothetical protein
MGRLHRQTRRETAAPSALVRCVRSLLIFQVYESCVYLAPADACPLLQSARAALTAVALVASLALVALAATAGSRPIALFSLAQGQTQQGPPQQLAFGHMPYDEEEYVRREEVCERALS